MVEVVEAVVVSMMLNVNLDYDYDLGGKPLKVFPPGKEKQEKENAGEPPLCGGGPPTPLLYEPPIYYDEKLGRYVDRRDSEK